VTLISRYRQALSFQAEVPNFLKRLREPEKPIIERPDRPDKDDEKPVIELSQGVNAYEAELFLEGKLDATPKKIKTDKPTKSDSKKKQLADQKKEKQQNIKSIKNKQLLSFDDEQ
jgi:hypothetical protein